MHNLVYTLLNPFSYYIFTRILFPLYYLFSIFFSDNTNNTLYFYILLSILVLVYPICKIFFRMLNVIKELDIGKIPEQRFNDKLYIFISFIYTIFVLILTGDRIPLLTGGGSNSIVELNEQSRIITLLFAGLLLPKLACVTLYFRNQRNYIWIILLIILSLLTGKKGAILQIVWSLVLGAFFYRKKIAIGAKQLFTFFVFGFGYIIYTFFQTSKLQFIGSKFGDSFFSTIYNLVRSLIFYASNVHLVQIFEWGGDKYFYNYLDEVTIHDYFLNPILKILGFGGVDKTLGTYMTAKIFGTDFPIGAPMTLIIEGYAVGGILVGILTIFISVILLWIIFKKIGKKGIYHVSFTSNSIILMYLPFILTDPLNGYKNFFFVFLLHFFIRTIILFYPK